MAEQLVVPNFVRTLTDALAQNLSGARIDTEQIRGDRYRFVVVWDGFQHRGHPERQRHVWAIAEQAIPGADLLNVGMIITMSPDEVT